VLKQRKRIELILNWNVHSLLSPLRRGYRRAKIENDIQIGNQLTRSNALGGKER
jgi:hypothetical protein